MEEAPRDLESDVKRLSARCAELEAELARVRAVLRAEGKLASVVGKLAVLTTLGVPLTTAIHGWIRAFKERRRIPEFETAELLAAVVRRVIRVGLVAAVIASLPILLLLWQNHLFSKQLEIQQQQLNLQIENAQRQEYYGLLYEKPSPAVRRQEAVRNLLETERDAGRDLDLREANLEGVVLDGLNLAGADFEKANLRNASLKDANLEGADFRMSNLTGADLKGANLKRATLKGAIYNDTTRWPSQFRVDESGAEFQRQGER